MARPVLAVAFVFAVGAFVQTAAPLIAHAQQQPPPASLAASTAEIDREIWTALVESVKRDDIAQMSGTYAADAVLVTPRTSQLMRNALAGWGRDMVTNKAKGTTARVEFRFSKRLDGAETAFESGMFHYVTTDKDGTEKGGYYPFEELLVKSNGHWKILMERQFAGVTEAEWNKLPRWP